MVIIAVLVITGFIILYNKKGVVTLPFYSDDGRVVRKLGLQKEKFFGW